MNSFVKNNSLLLGTPKAEYAYDPNKLVLVYDTSKEPANNTVSFPVNSSLGESPNITVDWGDNTSNVYTTTGWKTHTYSNPGIYVVQVSGSMKTFSFGGDAANTNNKLKLVRCLSFGNIGLTSLFSGFNKCVNLVEVPESIPSTVTSISQLFYNITTFNEPSVTQWNTTNITNMSLVFHGNSAFNQPVGSWNTGNVTTMNGMFTGCASFNQPLNSWNVSKVINMNGLFYGASVFNQNLNSWDTSNVTDFGSMFRLASNYNQSMNSWDTSKVTTMGSMFLGASSFNGNISSWNTSNVTNMGLMFYYCGNFNQNISSWNTSKVTTMSQMFSNCINFNQNIGLWNVGLVAVMDLMLDNADSFSSNLGNWNLASLNSSTAILGFMRFATGLTVLDYDNTLIGWNNNKASFRNDININFGGSKYSSSAAGARSALIAYGWTITDGGVA